MSYKRNEWSTQGRELCTHSNALPELQDLNPPEPVRLQDLLAEYDLGVLKQWLADQRVADEAQEVPEEVK